jgi:hypothetical protein
MNMIRQDMSQASISRSRAWGFQFGSADVDRSIEPIQDLLPLGTRHGEPTQLGFARARQIAFFSRSRHARRKTACLIFEHEAAKHYILCGPRRLIGKTGIIRKDQRRMVGRGVCASISTAIAAGERGPFRRATSTDVNRPDRCRVQSASGVRGQYRKVLRGRRSPHGAKQIQVQSLTSHSRVGSRKQ